MSGRHSRSRRSPVIAAVGVVGVLAAAGVTIAAVNDDDGTDAASGSGSTTSATGASSSSGAPTACASAPEPVRVLVAPELGEITRAAADRVVAADPCRRYAVTAAAGRDGLKAALGADAPQVWIPDSSTWLDALPESVAARWDEGAGVASSPVGLARPDGTDKPMTSWASVIRGANPVKLLDPDRDAASRLAFNAAMTGQAGPLDRTTGARLIVMSRFTARSVDDALAGFEKDPKKAPAFPISERAAYALHEENPEPQFAVAYPQEGTVLLDYPWLARAGMDAEAAGGAAALEAELAAPSTQEQLTAAGFRQADGTGPGPRIDGSAAPDVLIVPLPSATERAQADAQWHVLATDMRMMAVIDVSGSMKYASGTADLTRMDVLLGAANRALQTLAPGSRIGAWIFSTAQGGPTQDWRELAPVRRLDAPVGTGTHRQELQRLLVTVPERVAGDTGLYDTTLAAFRTMLKDHDPNYVNSVVLMTDGINDDTTGGLSLTQLLARLREEFDPQRPVRVVTIGMGEADADVLKKIAKATGGTSYIANRPADIDRVLVQALLARPLPVAP